MNDLSGENEGKTLVITNETNFDTIEEQHDGLYDIVKISNMNIDKEFAYQLCQKSLNFDLIRLEIDGCTISPKILDKILDPSILDLIITNCELHIQDLCDIIGAFNGSGNHNVDLSKSKIYWNEGLGKLDRVGPPPMYEYYKVGNLGFNGSEITNGDKNRLKNKCRGWDVKFVN